jgi:hypothetical protein
MRLFKREKNAAVANDAVAEKIANHVIASQRQFADYLNKKMARFPRKAIGYFIGLLCIAFGGYCAYLLITSIIN